jgi:hypothetical protein
MPDKPKRFQSATERDLGGLDARADRDALDTAVSERAHAEWEARSEQVTPIELPTDDITAQYEAMPEDQRHPEALHAARARRPTPQRFRKLEDKTDEIGKQLVQTRLDMAKEVGAIKGEVAGIKGELAVLPELVSLVKTSLENTQHRETVTFTAQVDVDTAKKTAEIEKEAAIAQARETAKIDEAKAKAIAEVRAEVKDGLDRRAARRKLWVKVLGAGIGAVAAIAAGGAVHWLIHELTGWL